MSLDSLAAVVAAVAACAGVAAALLALIPAGLSARATRKQVALQLEAQRDALQPSVWADIRPSRRQSHTLMLVLANEGPTVARNVRVTSEPPFRPFAEQHVARMEQMVRKLEGGALTLTPGRRMEWVFAFTNEVPWNEDEDLRFALAVEGDGPFGPLRPQTIDVDLNSWAEQVDNADGTLLQVRDAIKDQTTEIRQLKVRMRE